MKRRKKSESKQIDDIDLFDYSDGDDNESASLDEEVEEEKVEESNSEESDNEETDSEESNSEELNSEESDSEESNTEETYDEIINLDKVDISKNSDLKNIPASSMFAGVFARKAEVEDKAANKTTDDTEELLDSDDVKNIEESKSEVDGEVVDEKQTDEMFAAADETLEEAEDVAATKGLKIAGIVAICIAVLGLAAIILAMYFLAINPYYMKDKPTDSFEHSDIASATDLNPSGVLALATPSDVNFDDIKDVVADIDANSTINNVPVTTVTDATVTDASATDATPSDATSTDAEVESTEEDAEHAEADGTDAEDYYE